MEQVCRCWELGLQVLTMLCFVSMQNPNVFYRQQDRNTFSHWERVAVFLCVKNYNFHAQELYPNSMSLGFLSPPCPQRSMPGFRLEIQIRSFS